MIQRSLVFVLSGCLVACTGEVKTKSISPADLVSNSNELTGIIIFPPALFSENYVLTTRLDEKGNVVRWAAAVEDGKKCEPTSTSKIVTRADYAHPKVLYYEHGILEQYKFGAELTPEGMLKSLTTEGSPDRGETFSNLASAAAAAAPIAAGGAAGAAGGSPFPPCNSDPSLIGISRYDLKLIDPEPVASESTQ